jgi:hypothetical protein
VGHLAHLLRKQGPDHPASWLLLLCGVLLLARPRSRVRLAALALSQIWLLLSRMPGTDNHLYLMGFVNAGLLAAVATSWLRDRVGAAEHVETAAPYARLTLLLAYSAAAVAKLNQGFFDPAQSCAVTMFYDALRIVGVRRPFVPTQLEALMPFVIAGTELAIPLLLLVRRTRIAGVVVAVLLHLAMSLSPTATAIDFTLVLFALVFLFLPASAATAVRQRRHDLWARIGHPVYGSKAVRVGAPLLLFCFLGTMLVLSWATVAGKRNWLLLAPTALLVGGALLHLARRSSGAATSDHLSWRISPPQVVLIALLLINISTPYLGLKTTGTFTMYSNLQTANRQSNHLLIPRAPYRTRQDDLVRIVDSSNSSLKQIAKRGSYITWHELRRSMSADPGASITYIRNGGDLVALAEAREDPELVRRDPVLHWLIGYRTYDPVRSGCLW